ncbi:hypothetical protein [Shimazuella kribbensis]|uniref:hypothetical protein n=1 Tax=Shimazuella kribbensis TaxID=139808 RepID=UPI0003F4C880|nr:hypothetical protein [Shimazuella kribbensis]
MLEIWTSRGKGIKWGRVGKITRLRVQLIEDTRRDLFDDDDYNKQINQSIERANKDKEKKEEKKKMKEMYSILNSKVTG